MKIPEGAVKEVLGGCDRGYDLPERTPKELEMRIGWTKIGNGEVVEEEVLNGTFEVPYPYVEAEEVADRPQLRKETLEATDVVGFGYESDGRESEAKEFDVGSEGSSEAGGFQMQKSRLEKAQAKYEKRVLHEFRYQMQTSNPERVAFVDMEFMEMSGFCREGIGSERRSIRDCVFNEQTGKLEDKMIMSWSTLEYMRENLGGRETEYSFDTIVKLAEWHVKGKYPPMIARLPRELAWAFRAEDGAKIHLDTTMCSRWCR